MGVSHLKQHAARAKAAKAPSGRSDAVQITGLNRPASTSPTTRVPNVPGVERFANRSGVTNTGVSASQPQHGGARAGAKSGQPKVGSRSGAKRGMSGGRAG